MLLLPIDSGLSQGARLIGGTEQPQVDDPSSHETQHTTSQPLGESLPNEGQNFCTRIYARVRSRMRLNELSHKKKLFPSNA